MSRRKRKSESTDDPSPQPVDKQPSGYSKLNSYCRGCGSTPVGGIVAFDRGIGPPAIGTHLCRECLNKVYEFIDELSQPVTPSADDPDADSVDFIWR